jgi:hypothetical protein
MLPLFSMPTLPMEYYVAPEGSPWGKRRGGEVTHCRIEPRSQTSILAAFSARFTVYSWHYNVPFIYVHVLYVQLYTIVQ